MFSIGELIDVTAMTLFIGFIFQDQIRKPSKTADPFGLLNRRPRFDWENIKYAAMVVAPAIILHEFGHKFVAMAFGMQATFQAAYFWLVLGTVMKLAGVSLIFFVPAYVSWKPTNAAAGLYLTQNPWVGSLIAFAGPAVNLVLWLVAKAMLKKAKGEKAYVLAIVSKINQFLFIFNMIPFPGFDGFHVFQGLYQTIFG